jgi:hypothetical protein
MSFSFSGESCLAELEDFSYEHNDVQHRKGIPGTQSLGLSQDNYQYAFCLGEELSHLPVSIAGLW